ncbi:TPA: hypothetical protein ACK2W8_004700 [Klebsiella oxytoca]
MNKRELIDLFMIRTGESKETAKRYLENNYWSLPTALTFYNADKNEGKYNDNTGRSCTK